MEKAAYIPLAAFIINITIASRFLGRFNPVSGTKRYVFIVLCVLTAEACDFLLLHNVSGGSAPFALDILRTLALMSVPVLQALLVSDLTPSGERVKVVCVTAFGVISFVIFLAGSLIKVFDMSLLIIIAWAGSVFPAVIFTFFFIGIYFSRFSLSDEKPIGLFILPFIVLIFIGIIYPVLHVYYDSFQFTVSTSMVLYIFSLSYLFPVDRWAAHSIYHINEIIENLDQAIVLMDGNDSIVKINEKAAALLGTGPGINLREMRSDVPQDIFSFNHSGKKEIYLRRNEGDVTIEIKMRPLRSTDGMNGKLIILKDVTDIREQENELRMYLDEMTSMRTRSLEKMNEKLNIEMDARREALSALEESEKRFRNFFMNAGSGMSMADIKGRFFMVNNTLCSMLGYSADELVGMAIGDIIFHEDREPDGDETGPVFRSGFDTLKYEKRCQHRLGQVIWGFITITLLRNGSGEPESFIMQIEDITENKVMETLLSESESKYRMVADNVMDNIWILEYPTLRFIYTTPSIEKIMGYSPREMLEIRLQDLIPSESMEVVNAVILEELEKEKDPLVDRDRSRTLVIEQIHKNGSTVWVEITASFLRYKDGAIQGILGITRDISDRKKAEAVLQEKTSKIKNLLDHAGQGFLSFGSDLMIENEYSYECNNIFHRGIANISFNTLLYPDDSIQQSIIKSMLEEIFRVDDKERIDIYLTLLPEEIQIQESYYEIQYRCMNTLNPLDEKKLMVIMTDITEKKNLENQIEDERDILRMVVRAVTDYGDFIDTINSFREFDTVTVPHILSSGNFSEDILFELSRKIHTFKGTFSQLDMINVVRNIHDFEDKLLRLSRNTAGLTVEEIRNFFDVNMTEWLSVDIEDMKKILGNRFMDRKKVLPVDPTDLMEIEHEMLSLLSPIENRQLIPKLRNLRFSSLADLMKVYSRYVHRLSEKFCKPVLYRITGGDDIFVDPAEYHDFIATLVHIFRNTMDHGIETMDERLEAGKPESGMIECILKRYGNYCFLEIKDDGRGVCVDRVREKVIKKGLVNAATGKSVSDEEIMQFIFEDNVSTRETLSEISGMGMGLAAVKKELELMGGEVRVESKKKQGASFFFKIPIRENIEPPVVTMSDVMDPVLKRAREFMREEMEITVNEDTEFLIIQDDEVRLYEISVLMNIKGILKGMFVMSFDLAISRYLTDRFFLGEFSEKEEIRYLMDTMAEISNTILGNSIHIFSDINDFITIEAPVALYNVRPLVRYTGSNIWANSIKTEKGNYSISFLFL